MTQGMFSCLCCDSGIGTNSAVENFLSSKYNIAHTQHETEKILEEGRKFFSEAQVVGKIDLISRDADPLHPFTFRILNDIRTVAPDSH